MFAQKTVETKKYDEMNEWNEMKLNSLDNTTDKRVLNIVV